jgi:hypothetical protein
VLDTRHGFAFAWLTQAAVENRAYLRYHFLEGTAWNLLESMHLTSIHGACVELNGHGVLLCGDSGAGKSTLAYACARLGWRFLSDDATCLIRKRSGRVVTGNPYQIRFRESARSLFRELAEQPSTLRATGEQAIELPTLTRPDIAIVSEATVDYVVFLNRREDLPAVLLPFPAERARQWLEQVVCFGELQVREAHLADIARLAGAEVLEMRYPDTESALRMLNDLIDARGRAKHSIVETVGAQQHG